MKRRMCRVLALALTVGMLGTTPAMQVLAEDVAGNQTEAAVDVLTEDTTEAGADVEDSMEENAADGSINPTEENDPEADTSTETPEKDAETGEGEENQTDESEDGDVSMNADEDTDGDEPDEETEEESEEEEDKPVVVAPMPDVNSFPASGTLFDDIARDSWYLPYVTYILNKGIMTGKGNNLFAPNESLARAQLAVVLWRISGSPQMGHTGVYPDVPAGQFYTSAIEWGSSEEVGVLTGYTNGNFGPNDNITREQLVTMLYRYAEYRNLDMTHTNSLKSFPDADKVTEFALEAMKWAVGSGIITGDKGYLNPQGNTNRAECATMLQRFCETYMPGELQNIDLSAGCSSNSITLNTTNGEMWVKVNGAWAARKIQGVQAKVWCYNDDARIYNMSVQSDGSYGAAVSVKNHSYRTGKYNMQAYVLLDAGVRIPVGSVQSVNVTGTPGYYQVMSHVQNIYNQVGRDLNACYWWCVNNIKYRTLPIPLNPPAGYTRSEWYAMQAFQYGSGNCYVYAAVFYYCALGLGYNAQYIEGQVGMAAGGYGPHGWVIIDNAYICDPEAQYEIGGYNFYMQPIHSPVLQYRW